MSCLELKDGLVDLGALVTSSLVISLVPCLDHLHARTPQNDGAKVRRSLAVEVTNASGTASLEAFWNTFLQA